jgi:hypothetical protein
MRLLSHGSRSDDNVKEISAMKIRHILIASAALAAGPAFAQDAAAPQASADCASLQSQVEQAASTASSEQMSAAQSAIDEGKKLCSEGKTEEGTAKLQEALSAISQPASSQQPTEQPPTEQPPPTDTQQPPQQ